MALTSSEVWPSDHAPMEGSQGMMAPAASIWLRCLMICRPIWQLSVVIVYGMSVHAEWQQALLTVGGVLLGASNFLLGSSVTHPKWKNVRRYAIIVEAVVAGVLGAWMSMLWPTGPACLLVLPTLMTYAWLFQRDVWQWGMAFELFLLYLIPYHFLRTPLVQPLYAGIPTWCTELVFACYGAILALGVFSTFLLQLQKLESQRLADMMHQVEHQSRQLAKANVQVNEYANQIYDLATAEERNRIAGEIHDTVAHRLTALLVQLQAARRILEQQQDLTATKSNLQVCEELSREALDEVRFSVRAIRQAAGTEGLDSLRRLAMHYATVTGMQIRLYIDKTLSSPPAQVIAVLYRLIQESLTNAQRHGRATEVQVTLARSGAQVHLCIEDNGRGAGLVTPGFGQSSMRDRVIQFGGEIHFVSEPGVGYKVDVKLPMWEGTA